MPSLAGTPDPLVFVGALLVPPFLLGCAAFLARRCEGVDRAVGHVVRVSLPLAAMLWATSGSGHALAFPARSSMLVWWALGTLGLMLLAGLLVVQAQPEARAWHRWLTPLGLLAAASVGLVVWQETPLAGSSWLRLAIAAGSAAALGVVAHPVHRGFSFGAFLAGLGFIVLDVRRWL